MRVVVFRQRADAKSARPLSSREDQRAREGVDCRRGASAGSGWAKRIPGQPPPRPIGLEGGRHAAEGHSGAHLAPVALTAQMARLSLSGRLQAISQTIRYGRNTASDMQIGNRHAGVTFLPTTQFAAPDERGEEQAVAFTTRAFPVPDMELDLESPIALAKTRPPKTPCAAQSKTRCSEPDA